jgi:hypothetical protein
VRPDQGWKGEVEQLVLLLEHQPPALLERIEVLAPANEGCAAPNGFRLQNLCHGRRLLGHDTRHAALHDAGLLESDLLHRVAQLVRVIHGDGRDDRECGCVDHVGRIETAAEPDLEKHHIGRRFRKSEERRRRRDLEKRDRRTRIDFRDALEQMRQPSIGNGLRASVCIGDGDALVEAHEVRRRIDMYAACRSLENGFQEGNGRAFAVGARHMDDGGEFPFRMAKLVEKPLETLERQIDKQRMEASQIAQNVVARAHRR